MSGPKSLIPDKARAIEDEFHVRLGRLTQAAAELDFNVGLSLKWLARSLNADVTADLNPKFSFSNRLTKLKELLLQAYGDNHPALRSDFEQWFKRANDARTVRNDYVHARWGIRHAKEFGDHFIGYVPLNWEMDPGAAPKITWLSPADLDREVAELHRLSNDYHRLTKKYGAYIR